MFYILNHTFIVKSTFQSKLNPISWAFFAFYLSVLLVMASNEAHNLINTNHQTDPELRDAQKYLLFAPLTHRVQNRTDYDP